MQEPSTQDQTTPEAAQAAAGADNPAAAPAALTYQAMEDRVIELEAHLAKAKEDFFKLHNADFYFIYTDPKGKVVTKDEVNEALKKQNEASGLNSNSILSPKK